MAVLDKKCERMDDRTMATGETGQAIALASLWGVLVLNLQCGRHSLEDLRELVQTTERAS